MKTLLTALCAVMLAWSAAAQSSLPSPSFKDVSVSGNLALPAKPANTIMAAPSSGTGAPTFRALTATDIPSLDAAKVGTGILDIARIPSIDATRLPANQAKPGGVVTGTTDNTSLSFYTSNLPRWNITGAGVLFPQDDLAYDLGGSTKKVKNAYLSNVLSAKQTMTGTADGLEGLFYIQDFGNVGVTSNGSLRQASISIKKDVNGSPVSGVGYTLVGANQYNYLGYGQSNSTQTGTVANDMSQMNIYNVATPTSGRNEFTPEARANLFIQGGTFASGQNYYYDYNLQSAPSAAQEGYLGYSKAVQKRSPGNVLDATHNGSFGLDVVTTPNNIGFDPQNHSGDTTYPLTALASLTGWSGLQSAASGGGQIAASTPGALVGLRIGGPVTGVWANPATQRSYIPIGLDIRDFTTTAINIAEPSTGHATTGNAITIAAGAGNVIVGDSIYAGTTAGGGDVSGRKLIASSVAATQQAIVEFRDQGTAKFQFGKQTDNSFFAYDGPNARNFLAVDLSGNLTLGEGTGKSITLSGVTTGTNAYFLCMSSGGVVQLQASACTISSKRFKDIVSEQESDDALAKILRMKPTVFTMKKNEEAEKTDINYGRPQIGLLAEDIADIDPKAAIFEQDGTTAKSYRQESVIALLVGSVQAQDAEIKKLRDAITGLQKQ